MNPENLSIINQNIENAQNYVQKGFPFEAAKYYHQAIDSMTFTEPNELFILMERLHKEILSQCRTKMEEMFFDEYRSLAWENDIFMVDFEFYTPLSKIKHLCHEVGLDVSERKIVNQIGSLTGFSLIINFPASLPPPINKIKKLSEKIKEAKFASNPKSISQINNAKEQLKKLFEKELESFKAFKFCISHAESHLKTQNPFIASLHYSIAALFKGETSYSCMKSLRERILSQCDIELKKSINEYKKIIWENNRFRAYFEFNDPVPEITFSCEQVSYIMDLEVIPEGIKSFSIEFSPYFFDPINKMKKFIEKIMKETPIEQDVHDFMSYADSCLKQQKPFMALSYNSMARAADLAGCNSFRNLNSSSITQLFEKILSQCEIELKKSINEYRQIRKQSDHLKSPSDSREFFMISFEFNDPLPEITPAFSQISNIMDFTIKIQGEKMLLLTFPSNTTDPINKMKEIIERINEKNSQAKQAIEALINEKNSQAKQAIEALTSENPFEAVEHYYKAANLEYKQKYDGMKFLRKKILSECHIRFKDSINEFIEIKWGNDDFMVYFDFGVPLSKNILSPFSEERSELKIEMTEDLRLLSIKFPLYLLDPIGKMKEIIESINMQILAKVPEKKEEEKEANELKENLCVSTELNNHEIAVSQENQPLKISPAASCLDLDSQSTQVKKQKVKTRGVKKENSFSEKRLPPNTLSASRLNLKGTDFGFSINKPITPIYTSQGSQKNHQTNYFVCFYGIKDVNKRILGRFKNMLNPTEEGIRTVASHSEAGVKITKKFDDPKKDGFLRFKGKGNDLGGWRIHCPLKEEKDGRYLFAMGKARTKNESNRILNKAR